MQKHVWCSRRPHSFWHVARWLRVPSRVKFKGVRRER